MMNGLQFMLIHLEGIGFISEEVGTDVHENYISHNILSLVKIGYISLSADISLLW